MSDDDDFEHGTSHGYQTRKCRCEACRRWRADEQKRFRAARLASGQVMHGTPGGYEDGCRCDECRAGRRITVETRVRADYARGIRLAVDLMPPDLRTAAEACSWLLRYADEIEASTRRARIGILRPLPSQAVTS